MKHAHIMLVEDNEGDIVLTQEVFTSSGLKNPISVVRDGEEALDFLYRRNKFIDAERPDLILMDINMPVKDGIKISLQRETDRQTEKEIDRQIDR